MASQRWLEVNDLGRLVNRYGRRQWHPTPVLLPGKSHGRKSLVGCSPWGRSESGTTERLHFHISLSCIGGGHGNPLQCSCLENPRDGGAWWAAVYGVAQSRTRLKQLSSSSSSENPLFSSPHPLAATDHFTVSMVLPFPGCHRAGIILRSLFRLASVTF